MHRWHKAAIGGRLLVEKKAGKGSVEVLTNGNDVFYFLSVFGVLSLFNGMATVKYQRRQKMTRPIVFLMAATAITKTVSFLPQTALVAHICWCTVWKPTPAQTVLGWVALSDAIPSHVSHFIRVDALVRKNWVSSVTCIWPIDRTRDTWVW